MKKTQPVALRTDDEDDAASSRVLRTPGPVGGLC